MQRWCMDKQMAASLAYGMVLWAWVPGCGVALAALPPAPQGVQVTTEYGTEFVTIGDPGNAPHVAFVPDARSVGSVGYTYRIARTETTSAQWAEFLTAYYPYLTDSVFSPGTTGNWVNLPNAAGVFTVPQEYAQFPSSSSWYLAARYCNWLHNDKRTDRAAFETGAYDVSTVPINQSDVPILEQATRSPGARFWIPSQDEWIKAAYYDPNRFGAGLGGYWNFLNASDAPPVPGLPGEPGATSNVGPPELGFIERMAPIASYPDARSAWGLFDTSGNEKEWLETLSFPGLSRFRLVGGSRAGEQIGFLTDELWWSASNLTELPPSIALGLRLASAIPTSSTACVMGVFAIVLFRRKRP